jgi:hypothetical protein
VRTVLAFVILVMVVAISVGGEASDPAEIAEASDPAEIAAALTERAAAHISKGGVSESLAPSAAGSGDPGKAAGAGAS